MRRACSCCGSVSEARIDLDDEDVTHGLCEDCERKFLDSSPDSWGAHVSRGRWTYCGRESETVAEQVMTRAEAQRLSEFERKWTLCEVCAVRWRREQIRRRSSSDD